MSTTNETASTAKEQAASVAGTGKEEAGAVASTATSAAKDVAGTATEQAKGVATEAVSQARDLVGEATSQARDQAGQQAQKAAQGVRSLATDLQGMAEGKASQGPAGDLVKQLAGKGHDLAGYLESADLDTILDDVRSLARRKPGLFLGGAGVVGFVVARLAKGAKQAGDSSTQSQSSSAYEAYPAATGYQTGTSYTGTTGYPVDEPSYGSLGTGSAGTAAGFPVDSVSDPVDAPSAGYDTTLRDRGDAL